MLWRLLGFTCAAAIGLTTATTACVQACDEIACGGGFEWTGRPAGDATVAAGNYVLSIALEDDSFTVECQVGATYEDSDCGEPTHVSGTIAWELELSLVQADDGDWNPKSPIGEFYLQAADRSGSAADGSYSETRGPTTVTIAISRDGTAVTEVDYTLEYVRDDDYRGHRSCGFCDETEARTHEW